MSLPSASTDASPRNVAPWRHCLLWWLPALIQAIVLARAATWAQRTIVASPLSPLLLGAGLGATVAVLANYMGENNPTRLRLGTVLIALACVAAEHLFFYLDYRESFSDTVTLNVDMQMIQASGAGKPVGFWEFLATGASRSPGLLPGWLWWIIDAVLTIVASIAILLLMSPHFRQSGTNHSSLTAHQ